MKAHLLFTEFDSLSSGALALVRTGRAGRNSVEWSEPFESGLYLQHDRQGHVCGLALQSVDWAEYDPRQCIEEDGTLVSEDYYLQVLKVVGRES